MSNFPIRVDIRECGPRDGLQIERKIIAVSDKVRMINDLISAGIRTIEVGSYVDPSKVPQMKNTKEVVSSLECRENVEYHIVVLGKRGLQEALGEPKAHKTGLIYTAASEAFLMANVGQTIEQSFEKMRGWIAVYREFEQNVDTLGVMAAFGCNFSGEVALNDVLALINRSQSLLAEYGYRLRALNLADTMGWANPRQIKRYVGAVQDRYPELHISLHLHDTRGTGLANAAAAMNMGIHDFDSSIGGLGGCPFAGHKGSSGNICTEDLAFMAEEMGIETGLDLQQLSEVANWCETIVGHPLPGKVMKAGSLAHYRRQANSA